MDNEELRKLQWILTGGKGCWHRWKERGVAICIWECTCGAVVQEPYLPEELYPNPTYAHSDEIADLMRERAIWYDFISDLMPKCEIYANIGYASDAPGNLCDILTTPTDLAQAIISWYEIDHKWNGGSYEPVSTNADGL